MRTWTGTPPTYTLTHCNPLVCVSSWSFDVFHKYIIANVVAEVQATTEELNVCRMRLPSVEFIPLKPPRYSIHDLSLCTSHERNVVSPSILNNTCCWPAPLHKYTFETRYHRKALHERRFVPFQSSSNTARRWIPKQLHNHRPDQVWNPLPTVLLNGSVRSKETGEGLVVHR